MRQALSEVTFAAATDEARPILTGVLTRFAGDKLTLAAADNYRIAVKTLPVLDPVEETTLVVPARSYQELMRVLSDTDDPVDIMLAQAKSQVIFHVEGTEVVSRLIDGQFPNYQQVLPGSHTTPSGRRPRGAAQGGAPVGAHRQLRGERRQAARRREREHRHHHRGRRRRRRRGGRGRGRARGRSGDHRLQRPLPHRGAGQNVDADQLALEFSGPLSPGVLKPIDDPDYVHVIMPVRTPS